ncbi:DUF4102 domain-containing protein [Alcaligenaceae bacterium]|nr:DUF4102 domain-containing protein [Alcaligenaceae bacterium]
MAIGFAGFLLPNTCRLGSYALACHHKIFGVCLGVCEIFLGVWKVARVIAPLTDLRCRQARYSPTGPKKLFDGGGLYLELTAAGSKIWRMKYRQLNRKENVLTFGDYPTVSLADARASREAAKSCLNATATHLCQGRSAWRRRCTPNCAGL